MQVYENMFSIINHQGNANQNHYEITTSYPLGWLLIKQEQQQKINVDKTVEKSEP